MYHKILVTLALDHDVSPQTLQIAETLLAEGGKIIGLHVYEAPEGSASAYLDADIVKAAFKNAEKMLAEKLAEVPHVTPVIVKGHSARTIIDYANQHDIDCIVIGSHKPGLSDYFLGSTASRVVRHANCAVHVQRTSG